MKPARHRHGKHVVSKEQADSNKAALIKFHQELIEDQKRREREEWLLTFLDIPHEPGYSPRIDAKGLLEMLMDDAKLQVLITKLRNKAFW